MRQSIITKVLPATNKLPARMKAVTSSGIAKTESYDHGLSLKQNHIAVFRKLALSLAWEERWAIGSDSNCNYVFVVIDEDEIETIVPMPPNDRATDEILDILATR